MNMLGQYMKMDQIAKPILLIGLFALSIILSSGYLSTNASTPDVIQALLYLNKEEPYCFAAGETFTLTASAINPNSQAITVDGYCVLDVYGSYFFWDRWSENAAGVTFEIPGSSTWEQVILEFVWPDEIGTARGLFFYFALLETGTLNLISNVDTAAFCFETADPPYCSLSCWYTENSPFEGYGCTQARCDFAISCESGSCDNVVTNYWSETVGPMKLEYHLEGYRVYHNSGSKYYFYIFNWVAKTGAGNWEQVRCNIDVWSGRFNEPQHCYFHEYPSWD